MPMFWFLCTLFDCLFPEAQKLGKNPMCHIRIVKKLAQLPALQGYTHGGALPADIIIIIIIMVIRLQWKQ